MTTESLIGIIGSVVGILAAGIPFGKWLLKSIKEQSLTELLKLLADTSLSKRQHQKILVKMNKMLRLSGKSIKKEYIENFVQGNKKQEDLFKEICLANDIEPTKDICMKFLGYDSRKTRDEYYSQKATSKTSEVKILPSVKSSDNEEQIVFLSDQMPKRYPEIYQNLICILDKHNVKHSLIEGTNDIWCRDYMPIQTKSGKLIQFRYEPSYLKGKKEWEDSRSDVHKICKKNNLKVQFSEINLDGGNVLICDGRAILSDRIFDENKEYVNRRDVLRKELAQLLECNEIIIIPSLNKTSDFTGHADGMVRFVNRNTVLGIKYDDKYKKNWWNNTQKVLEANNITFIEIPFFEDEPDSEHPESAIGVYVNYLEVNELIVLPVFGRKEDQSVINIIKEQFPNKIIETIDYNKIAKEGGLLNCTTWVLRK